MNYDEKHDPLKNAPNKIDPDLMEWRDRFLANLMSTVISKLRADTEKERLKIELEIEKNKYEIKKNRIIVTILIAFFLLMTLIPYIFGRELTCEAYQTATFIEKIRYITHPLITGPCDTAYTKQN